MLECVDPLMCGYPAVGPGANCVASVSSLHAKAELPSGCKRQPYNHARSQPSAAIIAAGSARGAALRRWLRHMG